MRSYTVQEIADLRQAVENKWLWGMYSPPQNDGFGTSRMYDPQEKAHAVEEIVRTHMIAGHTAADLYASERALKGGE